MLNLAVAQAKADGRDNLSNSRTDEIHNLLRFGRDIKVFLDKLKYV